MTQFYVPELKCEDEKVTIVSSEFVHIAGSHRAKIDDVIQLFNGNGLVVKAKIKKIYKDKLEAEIIEKSFVQKKDYKLVLCQGIIKIDRFELIIEKTTELGVDIITPLVLKHCVVNSQKFINKYERFRNIIIEAAKQSNNPYLPTLQYPTNLQEVFANNEVSLNIVCYKFAHLKMVDIIDKIKENKKIKVFIGPEGDFHQDEIKFLEQQKNVVFVNLGKNVLRAETAAVVVCSFVSQVKN